LSKKSTNLSSPLISAQSKEQLSLKLLNAGYKVTH